MARFEPSSSPFTKDLYALTLFSIGSFALSKVCRKLLLNVYVILKESKASNEATTVANVFEI